MKYHVKINGHCACNYKPQVKAILEVGKFLPFMGTKNACTFCQWNLRKIVDSSILPVYPYLEDTLQGYCTTALWTDGDIKRGIENFDSQFTITDIEPASLEKIKFQIKVFYWLALENGLNFKNEADIDWKQIGIDLHLTRNHHGAGFWDKTDIYGKKNADIMTEAAHNLGSLNLYLVKHNRLIFE